MTRKTLATLLAMTAGIGIIDLAGRSWFFLAALIAYLMGYLLAEGGNVVNQTVLYNKKWPLGQKTHPLAIAMGCVLGPVAIATVTGLPTIATMREITSSWNINEYDQEVAAMMIALGSILLISIATMVTLLTRLWNRITIGFIGMCGAVILSAVTLWYLVLVVYIMVGVFVAMYSTVPLYRETE